MVAFHLLHQLLVTVFVKVMVQQSLANTLEILFWLMKRNHKSCFSIRILESAKQSLIDSLPFWKWYEMSPYKYCIFLGNILFNAKFSKTDYNEASTLWNGLTRIINNKLYINKMLKNTKRLTSVPNHELTSLICFLTKLNMRLHKIKRTLFANST